MTDAEYVASLYDAEIRHVDDGIAQILATLDETGLAENTLVVITGDHGESMYQHDIYFDHHGLYDDVIHVPLIMRLPGSVTAGNSIFPMVQHLDVMPTLLEAAGAHPPEGMDGSSLWPLATGRAEDSNCHRVICCENTWQSKWAMRTDTHKFILSRQPDRHNMPPRELYDLVSDPEETCNLAQTHPELAGEMETELESWIALGLARTGRTEDPLRAQPITLGRRWNEWLNQPV